FRNLNGKALDEVGTRRQGPNKEANARTYKTYTVKKGDSLWKISQQFPGISAEDIMNLNQIDEAIHPGMKLKIPTATK
ncbi:MAG TPA: LysM peptidoglycan-binding domain-containing protein, partial [Bacteroidetes bacterium]|nr:LysM peptidoglycan-binding domain-containing protein [Bacteroidota bacterium]